MNSVEAKATFEPMKMPGLSPGRRMLMDLRGRIVQGMFQPGARLPTRADLERVYDTTPVTVQRVFDRLVDEGFVVAYGRRGTFVSDRPPHLCSFVLVFPYRPRPEREWPCFWHALAAEAARVRRPDVTLKLSYGNETHQDLDAYHKLVEDVEASRVAGLIFASRPAYLLGSPLLTVANMPRVAIMPTAEVPGVRAVRLAGNLMESLMGLLAAAGRKRVAVVLTPDMEHGIAPFLRAHNIPPHWVQLAHYDAPHAARNAVHLLMSLPGGERPDGLIIADDNLVGAATEGLAAAGIRVPEDVMVVAHGNFPHATRSAVPIRRIGYDVRIVLNACIDSVVQNRLGGSPPEVVEVPIATEESNSP